jgi:ketosteroid isomerase-like protein
MSQENVELVRRTWEAWERGDMEAVFALYDPDIVWDFSGAAGNVVLSDVYHGHDGVRRFFREWRDSFDSYYAHAEEFIDAGGDSVLVCARQGGRGKGSGVEIQMPRYWQIYRVREGRAVRVEVYSDQRVALEAAGLEE